MTVYRFREYEAPSWVLMTSSEIAFTISMSFFFSSELDQNPDPFRNFKLFPDKRSKKNQW